MEVTKDELQEKLNALFRDLYESVIKPATARSETASIKIAAQEGGDWIHLQIHSLEMPDGSQWDARNGWRNNRANEKQ